MISQLVITIRIWEAAVTTVDTKTKQSDGDHNFHASRLVTVACHNLYFKPRFKSSTPTLKRLVEIQPTCWRPNAPLQNERNFCVFRHNEANAIHFKKENINCKNRSPWPMLVFLKSILNFAPRLEVILINTSHDNADNDLDIICRCSFRCSSFKRVFKNCNHIVLEYFKVFLQQDGNICITPRA